MTQHELAALKDIHKECLRLTGRNYSSKEIARMLGISKHTVDQRLRTATQRMGASSRHEAARRFCDMDVLQTRPTQTPDLCDPVLYDAAYIPVSGMSSRDGEPDSEKDPLYGTAKSKLQDAQAPYSFADASKIETLFSNPVLFGEEPRSWLSLRAKALLVVGIAAISLLAFGAAIAALEALSRI
ncbi:LuxR family transcriptional regulator [Sphingorhabdus sp. IMCC26285]|uniref:LuxR family transcriptional regulator n=2 Tax=Sphingorhabdus profundilacus TaxID=2509718 RepID=A0A6I4LXF0_9SPHN|nr:helix-turn-helix transcriptional regulator [Sphingorhabdus profundilacus]MVZ98112.1 LuxR family transcriptional regulator [Sphingorhabdus profundilacus]